MNPKPSMVHLVCTELTGRKKCCHIIFALAQMLCRTTTSHLLFVTVYKEVAASFYKITNINRTRYIFTE